MFSFTRYYDDTYHNIFKNGDWNLEKVTNYFGDTPTILTRVLTRRSCSVDVVTLLIKHGAEINCQDEFGYSPLRIALEISNDKEVIQVLLESGAEVNKVDSFGRTPLLLYLQREDCSVGIVKVLLNFNADVNSVDIYGDSPLATAIREVKDDAVIRVLVERGAEVNDFRKLHNTPLLVLLRRRKNCSVDTVKLLLAKGADINCVDKCGCSPLVTALKQHRDEAVIQALLEKGANVNMICKYGETPLLLYLSHDNTRNCSIDIVKLLLHYKAEVNSINSSGNSPLTTALKYKLDEMIVRSLLEGGGAGVDTLDASRKSPLCIAFRHSSNDIVKLLLETGFSPNACEFHGSALLCATDFSCSGLREDILKLLLDTNINVNSVEEYGQSVLCFALQHGAKAHDIQLLLDAGASLNICARHSSPLICATDGHQGAPLREDVVQLLLDNGACVDDKGIKVLQSAVGQCKYETGAIQLLLDLPGMNADVVVNEYDETLLHLAVRNRNCKLDVIKLLVNLKAQVHKTSKFGETPLHYAVKNRWCDLSVINLLLQNGSPVNAKNEFDETPLTLAVKEHQPSNILKELLIAGAHIGKAKFCHGPGIGTDKYELLEFLERQWESWDTSYPETINCYRMLTKFFLLQNPEWDFENFKRNPAVSYMCINKLLSFLNECLSELGKMDSLQVGYGHTLRMFVSGDCPSAENIYDLNQMMLNLMKNTFPVFFDVISARLGRSIMEAEVKKLLVYFRHTHKSHAERVHLNCDVVYNISQYLSDDNLLKFILAFYTPVNQNNSDEAGKDDSLLVKRNSEPSSKRPKLYH